MANEPSYLAIAEDGSKEELELFEPGESDDSVQSGLLERVEAGANWRRRERKVLLNAVEDIGK